MTMIYDRTKEIQEAITAGERVLVSLRNAKSNMDSARGWGLLDIFGGNGFSGFVKHMKIGRAQESLNQAKDDLERFNRELADVQDIRGLTIDISDFLIFADFFFDGLLADIYVQSKIKQAQSDIDNAIYRVEELLRRLRASL